MNDQEHGRIDRLAEAIKAMILAERELLARTRGKITVECYPKGEGYDLDLITKIR